MTDLIVELNLETIISFSEEDDAALEAAAEYIKQNWYRFITMHYDKLSVRVFCEIKE